MAGLFCLRVTRVGEMCPLTFPMCAHFIQANTNGRLHPAEEPSISPLNRGYLYGDAIYEVWRTYQGIIFTWEEHWARLFRSAKSLYMFIELFGK